MLVIVLIALGAASKPWAPASPRLLTRWASKVGPTHAHPEHPRPGQLVVHG